MATAANKETPPSKGTPGGTGGTASNELRLMNINRLINTRLNVILLIMML